MKITYQTEFDWIRGVLRKHYFRKRGQRFKICGHIQRFSARKVANCNENR